jgi:hypothetical protein
MSVVFCSRTTVSGSASCHAVHVKGAFDAGGEDCGPFVEVLVVADAEVWTRETGRLRSVRRVCR